MRALDALAGLLGTALPGRRPSALTLSEITDPATLWGEQAADPMRVGTAMRCVQIIGGAVGGCPLRVTNASGDEVAVAALNPRRPGARLPVPTLPPFLLWAAVVKAQALHGNAYLFKLRQAGTSEPSRIRGLQWIDPRRVSVELELNPGPGAGWQPTYVIDGEYRLTSHEIMHIPSSMLDDNGITGMSVVGALRHTLDGAAGADAAAERLFSRGLLSQGYLSTDQVLNEEQARIMRRRMEASLSVGVESIGNIPVLPQGLKWQQLAMSPADAQFLESRRFSVTEIARAFGVFGWMVNDQEKTTSWGSGIESQFTAFVQLTVNSYAQPIEQVVTEQLCPPGAEAEFKMEGLLRGDSGARATFYNAGITGGWLTPNDVRRLEGQPPVPWGDEPYRPYTGTADGQDDGQDDDTQGDDDAEQE